MSAARLANRILLGLLLIVSVLGVLTRCDRAPAPPTAIADVPDPARPPIEDLDLKGNNDAD